MASTPTCFEYAQIVQDLISVGDLDRARGSANDNLSRCLDQGDGADIALAYKISATAKAALGDVDEALPALIEAISRYKDVGDAFGQADCFADLGRFFMESGQYLEAMEAAQKAREMYTALKLPAGVGNMMYVQAMALKEEGDNIAALRMAEAAARKLVEGGDLATEVGALILMTQMKLALGKASGCPVAVHVLHLAEASLALATKRRLGDHYCIGTAMMCVAEVYQNFGGFGVAAKHAKDASVSFRRCGNSKKRALAMLIHSSSVAKEGDWKYALRVCEKATVIFDEVNDEPGRELAFDVLDEIEEARRSSLGLPSLVEEIQMRQQALENKKQKDQQGTMAMMQMMQMQMMSMQGMAQPQQNDWQQSEEQQWQQEQERQQAAAVAEWFKQQEGGGDAHGGDDGGGGGGAVVIKREGGPLQVSAGMDVNIVRKKIEEIAKQIIGEDDEEEIEMDTPLMQAGLTSNTAVLLRDELCKDVPGVNLPPTLMFDYPSIAAIADYIVEKAG